MGSSKGKPTDPKLREEVKESVSVCRLVVAFERQSIPHRYSCGFVCAEVKNETNKDGGGKGQMTAWKGSKDRLEHRKTAWHRPRLHLHIFCCRENCNGVREAGWRLRE